MKRLSKAIALAATLFVHKTDRGGMPYILHCLTVMNSVKHLGESAMIVGVLHDVIEDTHYTRENLLDEGYTEYEVEGVDTLSMPDDADYDDFVDDIIATRELAYICAKIGDIEHNSDITRLKGVRDKDFLRIQKYHRSYLKLKEARDEILRATMGKL